MDSVVRDDRGFTETAAVGILLGITLSMILTVGIYVLAVDVDEEATGAEFNFDYDGDADSLLIRYSDGETYPANEIVIDSGNQQASWGELAGLRANGTLSPGDALQLSRSGRWGRPITDATELRIHHEAGGNRTQLANWSA